MVLATSAFADPIHDAARNGDLAGVQAELDKGVDVNAKDDVGKTPLTYAARFGHKEVAELLLAKGADASAKTDDNGTTPLHHAALNGHKETAAMLIAKGADVNAKLAVDGGTPLYQAAWGGDVNAKDVDGETPLDWAIRGSTKAMPESAHPRHHHETADLLRKHGGKTGEELKAEGK
ncbi:MAG: ankyrin repeat domain-containing protein [Verrucomicrobiota bacterium]|nr:ankyrin repeat domain-containing protein [Verrucomicrobiota bacterium]